MKKTRFIIAAALVLLVTEIHAQSMQTLDVKAGSSFSTFRYEGDLSTERGTASGMNVALRYTYFFDGCLGAYAQLGTSKVHASEAVYFGAANKADGENYLYRYTYSENSQYNRRLLPVFSIGAAFRFDFGYFNITPRAGWGIAGLDCRDLEYERIARDGKSGPEYYSFSSAKSMKRIDYLIDSPTYTLYPFSFVFNASMQFSYSVGDDVALFIEPGLDMSASSMLLEKSVTSSSRLYEPENWAEAVAYASGMNQWQIDSASTKTTDVKMKTAPFFSIDLGLRINLF